MMATNNFQTTGRAAILRVLGRILEPWVTTNTAVLDEHTNLLRDLGLDSVAILQLVLGIEKEFGISIDNHELDMDLFVKTAHLMDIIERKLYEAD